MKKRILNPVKISTRFFTSFRMTNLVLIVTSMFFSSCSKPMAEAKVLPRVQYLAQNFDAAVADITKILPDILQKRKYAVAEEKKTEGVLLTTWKPTTSDSHYIRIFGRKDLSPNGGYYQLEIHTFTEGDYTRVRVASRMKSLAINLRSSGIEERRILEDISDVLRKQEPTITNLGIEND